MNLLSDTINFIQPFCRYQAANIGVNNMPILGIANLVRQTILSAPETWHFNRAQFTFSVQTTGGVQDYIQAPPNFGFLEKAVANDGTNSYEFTSVKNTDALSPSSGPKSQGRPMSMSVQTSDGGGNYTFRLSPVPDKPYTITIVYQQGPQNFTSTASAWAPIPDAFSDIYNNMVLGYYMDSCQDPRAPQYISRGVANLIARSTGLTEMDKAVFAAAYMTYEGAMLVNQLRLQQGQQAQAVR